MTTEKEAGERLADQVSCDRTEIIIERAINCGWITVRDRAQFKATLRIALDTEVEAGGPYLNNGWNAALRTTPAPAVSEIQSVLKELTDAAEHDMKLNQGGDNHEGEPEGSGGWWSIRTENAIRNARAVLAPNGQAATAGVTLIGDGQKEDGK